MSAPAAQTPTEAADDRPMGRSWGREGARLIVVVLCAWLGWQVVSAFLAERAAPGFAVRAAPSSGRALSRAAEAEWAAKRPDSALALTQEALRRSPFDVRAMRVLALALDADGQGERANEAMTLAGNWSLRDTAAHAWLVERRLRQGSYVSAFSHADTLMRREQPVQEQVFQLLFAAAVQDGRGLASLERFFATGPSWRTAFVRWLQAQEEGDSLLATLAISLQETPAPFTEAELTAVYEGWVDEGRIGAMRMVRDRIGRPDPAVRLQAPDFQPGPVWPFGWSLDARAGWSAEVAEDDLGSGRTALRVEYDSRVSGVVAVQLLLLDPGAYVLKGQRRLEFGDLRLGWRVRCLESGQVVASQQPERDISASSWSDFSLALTIPREGCSAQRLELAAWPSDVRKSMAAWFSGLSVTPANGL